MNYSEKIKISIAALSDYDKEKREFPVYDAWLFILCSFAVLLILIVWFGGMLFWNISHDRFWEQKSTATQTSRNSIDKDRLAQVLARYAERRTLLETRKESSFSATDPSL